MKTDYSFDITSIQDIECDHFHQCVQEITNKYDDLLRDCFHACGLTEDYILAHADEFSIRKEGYDGPFTYFWRGTELFHIYKTQQFDQNTYTIKYEVKFSRKED